MTPPRVDAILDRSGHTAVAGVQEPTYSGATADEVYEVQVGLVGWMLDRADGAGRVRALRDLSATVDAHEPGPGFCSAPRPGSSSPSPVVPAVTLERAATIRAAGTRAVAGPGVWKASCPGSGWVAPGRYRSHRCRGGAVADAK
jgi:hypothetical protein